ncbi:hypothetical protein AAY473_015293, partial [Plecturocebus cupreus]
MDIQFQDWKVNMGWVTPSWRPLKNKLYLSKCSLPNNYQNLECNPILLTTDRPAVLDQEPKNSTSYLPEITPTPDPNKHFSAPNNDSKRVEIIAVTYLRQSLETETGYRDVNAWVVGLNTDPEGLCCMLAPNQDKDEWGNETCKSLSFLFLHCRSQIPEQAPRNRNHSSCLSRQEAEFNKPVGELSNCTHIINVSDKSGNGNYSALPWADIWWYCGKRNLFNLLPSNWTGIWALVQFTISFTLTFHKILENTHGHGNWRDLTNSFDPNTYVDLNGVTREVHNEFKARNQKAARFESALFWWLTINKNVEWINYIYYNQQKFISYTWDTFKEVASQLDASSQIAWENRLALEMIVAEKGDICVMLGEKCTFLPDNTAPDGKNARIDDSFTSWLEVGLGNGKASILTSLITVVGVLTAVACCIIPCIRGLAQRLTETAINKQMPMTYQQKQEFDELWYSSSQMTTTRLDSHIEVEYAKMVDYHKKPIRGYVAC